MNSLLESKKTINTLLYIAKNSRVNVLRIYKDTNITYNYCLKSVKFLLQNNLITIDKKGRENIINMTNKGKIISNKLIDIIELMKK